MASGSSLYQKLVHHGFYFVPAGRYSLAALREAVQRQYPELCDDLVESTRYGNEQDKGVPQWHHWLRDALKDSKGRWVERDESSRQGFWRVLGTEGRGEPGNAVVPRLGSPVGSIEVSGADWTEQECRLLVAEYFSMLRSELLGHPYSKTQHRRQLRQSINRTDGSIERKHMNVSAVLVSLALPYIDGYKPYSNVQNLLVSVVEEHLEEYEEVFADAVVQRVEAVAEVLPPVGTAADVFEEPPDVSIPRLTAQPWKSKRGRKTDFAARDAENRRLGLLGERFTVELERRRLVEAGRDDLSKRVEHVAHTKGDGLGYDVISFHATTEAEMWLEVKTTTLAKFHPFLITCNEVECSKAEPERFHLYRVFDFNKKPRVFVLRGSLAEACALVPKLYQAGPPFGNANLTGSYLST